MMLFKKAPNHEDEIIARLNEARHSAVKEHVLEEAPSDEEFSDQPAPHPLHKATKITQSGLPTPEETSATEQTIGEMEGIVDKPVEEKKDESSKAMMAFFEEHIDRVSQNIGEVRNMVSSREESLKEMDAKIKGFDEILNQLQTPRILGELKKLENDIEFNRAEIEKINRFTKQMAEQSAKIEKLLGGITNFENIERVEDRIKEEASRADETKRYMERLSGKSEAVYDSLKGKITDIEKFDARIRRMEEMSGEMIRSMEELKLSVNDKVSAAKLDEMKKNMDNIVHELMQATKK
jgi:hypothetical protein